jgi:hypothetical protein
MQNLQDPTRPFSLKSMGSPLTRESPPAVPRRHQDRQPFQLQRKVAETSGGSMDFLTGKLSKTNQIQWLL